MSWRKMVAKLKVKFLPKDFQLYLFRKMHNLKKNIINVKEYTEEFYKVKIREKHVEDNPKKVSRYMKKEG